MEMLFQGEYLMNDFLDIFFFVVSGDNYNGFAQGIPKMK